MRFVISGEWTKNHLLKLIMYSFLVFISVFWVTNLLLFVQKMGFSYDGVVTYYRGSAERYLQPRSYQGLLEISHFHLFAMGILILTLTHLVLFSPISVGKKVFFIFISFSSAFLDEASGWLVRFVHPWFGWLKLLSFTMLQLSIAALVGTILVALLFNKPSGYQDVKGTQGSD